MITYLIIAIMLIVLLILFYRYTVSYNTKNVENFTTHDFENLKTGDLIFVSYKNLVGETIRVLSASQWSHIGMVYKDENNEIFILEIADYRESGYTENHGVIKIPYKNWLSLNKHHDISIRMLHENVKISNQKVLNEFEKLSKLKQQKLTDIMGLNRLMFFEAYDNEKISKLQKITCVEFIVLMLQNLELLDKTYMPSSFYPSDFSDNQFLNVYENLKKLN